MREILFRGKRLDNGEWAYGYVLIDNAPCALKSAGKCKRDHNGSRSAIYSWNDDLREYEELEVDPATIGQYTGLKDKNGKRIFEGDIIEHKRIGKRFSVRFDNDSARFILDGIPYNYDFTELTDLQLCVIGNIYDNPELLE